MSGQEPVPAEADNEDSSQQPVLRPDDGEVRPGLTEPPQSQSKLFWGCGGMMGCSAIFIVLIAGTIFVGAQSVFDGITSFFNLPTIDLGSPGGVQIPDNIYIPPVERVQALSELTTTRYNYAQVTSGQREMPSWLSTLYGDSVVMVAVGTIEAGIDVSQITEDDIQYDETTRTLSVRLPAPRLQSCFLDENQSYVVRRETATFAVPMTNLEDELRQRALRYYRDQAIEDGILIEAETDVRNSLSELLTILVNDETVTISILFDPLSDDMLLPATCQ